MVKEKATSKNIVKPLKPVPKLRFLPGEVDPIFANMDLMIYANHRANVIFARPKVDNKAPKFPISTWYNVNALNKDAKTIFNIDQQNMELLNYIYRVYLTGGKVECWNTLDSSSTSPTYLIELEDKLKIINRENKNISKMIKTASSDYTRAKFLKQWQKNKKDIMEKSRYPLWTQKQRFMTKTASIEALTESPDKVNRTRCFFDIELDEEKQYLGRLTIELYNDYVPKTCANFEAFCRGFNNLSYKGTPFHRIITNYWCQGGDVTKFDGRGGTSIYGDTFEDENFDLSHENIGTLSMWSNGPNTNNSKFNITFKALKCMDKCRVVFGRVISGLQHLHDIEYFGTKYGKPLKRVIISNCGVL